MSYDIVRRVRFDGDKVFITSTANNVRPRSYHEWEMTYRNENNPFKGKEAAEVEVMAGYESGSFQGGNNPFSRALVHLRHHPQYKEYDWRGNSLGEWKEKDKFFYQLLLTVLKTPQPKAKYVISKIDTYGHTVYFKQRKGASFAYWISDPKKATKFSYSEDAEHTKDCFPNSDSWMLIELGKEQS